MHQTPSSSSRGSFWRHFFVEMWHGKDLNRILSNIALGTHEVRGNLLDIGGGHGASYWRYLKKGGAFTKTSLDIDARVKPDIVLNLEHEDIPRPDGQFDMALLCNVLEHIRHRERVLARIRRVIKPGGRLVGTVPFLVAVHPDPHDYARMTNEELEALFKGAGFSHIRIAPVGRGPLTASFYQSEFLWPRFLKLFVIPLVLGLDAILLRMRPQWRAKFPLSYVFEVR